MEGEKDHAPAERAQLIALGVHRIADRFSAPDEPLALRLKSTATMLLEEIALLDIARTRDAAGTTRLIHQILGRLQVLQALLTFVKVREESRRPPSSQTTSPLAADIVLWHIERLADHFRKEDASVEGHVEKMHPQGTIISGTFSDIEREKSRLPLSKGSAAPSAEPPAAAPSGKTGGTDLPFYDPLLGPDSRSSASAKNAAPSAVAASAEVPRRDANAASASSPTGNGGNGAYRQKRILDFFTLRRHAQLKEVLALFPGVSEKTVRNDLMELCRLGHLRRVGLAPRSHYVLTA